MMTLAIELHDISVQYRLPREQLSGIKEFAIRWAQGRLRYHQFWALRGVDLMIERGESFGVIGRNGAGKSTLLKVMARVLKPTEGHVVMRGRIAPLLELGAGFHPELTGRENVYLNGALIGLPRQKIAAQFESIVDFAEIDEFIDVPLRTYSTGMVARLGFAVATSIRPEILLIDEVLSVGDTAFQEKCLARMRAFQSQGTTIVLVSHSMGRVQEFCQRALCLEGGQVAAQGGVNEIVERYSSGDLVIR
ncbi:MAG: ABC transporter ATP-binding protein [Anaerolineales bacterium]|nr:ABC transporter ATP-binding protein [Anaerolineales bacterium]